MILNDIYFEVRFMKNTLLRYNLIILFLFCRLGLAQVSAEAPIIVCEKYPLNTFTEVQGPDFRKLKTSVKTSNITVDFTDFPEAAKKPFLEAVSVWESILISRIPIKIKTSWESINATTLASTGSNRVYRDFSNSALKNVWYPPALAEAISGKNLNEENHELTITVNKNIAWSYSTNGAKENFKYDLMTVIIHEIAHGIGFLTSMKLGSLNENQGEWGISGFPIIYDVFVQNGNKQFLTSSTLFGNPSLDLKTNMTGGNLFFNIENKAFKDDLPKMYAPSLFRSGGSISHLDEIKYPKGSANSLMSPQIGIAEINHFPGPIILAILNQMGWPVNFYSGSVVTSLVGQENTEKYILFPNPVVNEFKLIIPAKYEGEIVKINIIDNSGRLIFEDKYLNEGIKSLYLNSLSSGNYYCHITIGNTQKVIPIFKY